MSEDLITKILSFDYIINDISDHKIIKIGIELNGEMDTGRLIMHIFLDINYQKKIKKNTH